MVGPRLLPSLCSLALLCVPLVSGLMYDDYECSEQHLLPNGDPCGGEEEESIKEAYHEEHKKLLTKHPWSHSEFRIARPLGVALKTFTPYGSPPARRIHPDVRDRKFVLDLGSGTGQTLSYLMVRFQEVNYKPTEWAAGGVESQEFADAVSTVQDYSFAEAVNFKATARNMLPVDFLDPADDEWTSVEVPPPDSHIPMRKFDGVMATNMLQYLPLSTAESIIKVPFVHTCPTRVLLTNSRIRRNSHTLMNPLTWPFCTDVTLSHV